jgi:hypothetical protein
VLAKQATTQLSAKWSNQTTGRCSLSDTPCKVIFLWLHQQRRNRHMWSTEVCCSEDSNFVEAQPLSPGYLLELSSQNHRGFFSGFFSTLLLHLR